MKMESQDSPVTVIPKKGIKVADTRATRELYESNLAKCQQDICREVAKEWIKTIEPKKQSAHPYTDGETRAPEWWPLKGAGQRGFCRHKEPDHISKTGTDFKAQEDTIDTP